MIDEEQDISEVELDRIIDEKKRHKELISAISKAFKNDDKDLSNDLIKKFIDKLDLLQPKELPTPQVAVNIDQDGIIEEIKSLKNVGEQIIRNQEIGINKQDRIIELLNMRPSKLDVVRNPIVGTINYIDIKYKSTENQ